MLTLSSFLALVCVYSFSDLYNIVLSEKERLKISCPSICIYTFVRVYMYLKKTTSNAK